jgi:hypothetical protein
LAFKYRIPSSDSIGSTTIFPSNVLRGSAD